MKKEMYGQTRVWGIMPLIFFYIKIFNVMLSKEEASAL